jgi:DNA N-6-adenine-methyltransferase (Dam)
LLSTLELMPGVAPPLRGRKTSRRNGFGGHERLPIISSCEWFTPRHIVDRLGIFNLDPCTSANRPFDTALHHFTKDEDGLTQRWFGRVWLNPPYDSRVGVWLQKLAAHGDGIALVFARTDTEWFQRIVFEQACAVHFLRRRVFFLKSDGSTNGYSAGAPSCLIAYGAGNTLKISESGLTGRMIDFGASGRVQHVR